MEDCCLAHKVCVWKIIFQAIYPHQHCAIFFNYVIFIKTARMVSSLCCVSTLSALSSNHSGNKTTHKRSVERSTEYSLFCVIKFAVTSKHAVFWQNMLLQESQKCLNTWRKKQMCGSSKDLRFDEASAASHCLNCLLFVLELLDMPVLYLHIYEKRVSQRLS